MAANPVSRPPAIAANVLRGLMHTPKSLPPFLFYDDAGSALFEEITRLPEYYLTRTERGIFQRYGAEVVREVASGEPLTMIELGAGSAEKTGLLIEQALRRSADVIYEPIDVSRAALQAAATKLAHRWPQLRVQPMVADYTNGFRLNAYHGTRRLVLWIGSSIGNFEHVEAVRILRNVRQRLQPDDMLLLGMDLAPSRSKPVSAITAAYNDAAGVTARFNCNVLARLNRELGANFDLNRFVHIAEWNSRASRMEMYLESSSHQQVRIPALSRSVRFIRGERIHTENSYKYAPSRISELLSEAGFAVARTWNDPKRWFSVILARIS